MCHIGTYYRNYNFLLKAWTKRVTCQKIHPCIKAKLEIRGIYQSSYANLQFIPQANIIIVLNASFPLL